MRLYNFHKYYVLLFCTVLVCYVGGTCQAQIRTVNGNVYAFKSLGLNKIEVSAKKSGNVVFTNIDGSFTIECCSKDKLVFKGKGFERTAENTSNIDSVSVKLIFKGSQANRTQALCNSHVTKDEIDFAMKYYSNYNTYHVSQFILGGVNRKNSFSQSYTSQISPLIYYSKNK